MVSGSRDVTPRSSVAHKPPKTATIVAQRIVREITDEGLVPGDRLPPERDMLDTYGVGRGTLREALRVLELQGVLTIRPGPGGGPTVSAPDSRHLAGTLALLMQFAETPFRSVVEARLYVEPLTARLAAARAEPQIAEELRASVERMRDALDDRDEFLDENRRFHDAVAWASGNPLFGYFINSLHWITDGTVLGTEYPKRFRKIVLEAHERICETVEAQDPDAAYEAMYDHMQNTLVYFEKNFHGILDQRLSWELYGA